jgi:hypothetical protein
VARSQCGLSAKPSSCRRKTPHRKSHRRAEPAQRIPPSGDTDHSWRNPLRGFRPTIAPYGLAPAREHIEHPRADARGGGGGEGAERCGHGRMIRAGRGGRCGVPQCRARAPHRRRSAGAFADSVMRRCPPRTRNARACARLVSAMPCYHRSVSDRRP